MKNALVLGFAISVGFIFWLLPEPAGVHEKGWELFAIFVSTMIAIILKPLPMGVISVLALTVATATNTLTFAQAFSGFSNDVVWLVVFAFFVARGFILTGLGNRLAYTVMSVLGKNSLGLGYGLVATDLILAPTIPSVTARVGGIVFPIVKSLSEVFTGASHDPKMGGFLSLTAFQGSAITSAMFLTAMAGNPLIAELARGQGVEITWASWALAAFVPGILSLIAVPYVMYKISPPTIRKTPHAKAMAHEKLKAMGPMRPKEWIMLGTFIMMIILWIAGPFIGMKATVAAMIGLGIFLLSGIMTWRDVLNETGAWDTFIWFATLVTLAGFLNTFGLTQWFSQWVVGNISGFSWVTGFVIVSLIYFYSHYFFASIVAHVGAMYAPLLIIAIALGTPPELAALTLAFFSNLFSGLTHYGSGPAPILFGTGYVSVSTWWKMGLYASFVNISIWMIIGGIWWKIIGLW
ncbi:MAG: anion permease [Chlamydiae bacterium CG10_big_fil_rev_8_21_14_0_10_42_34]|nr:MAG: anion permease [Chlamydiae bacterium CG10_big_fil_rev_8_21_14_0_10_42_34]